MHPDKIQKLLDRYFGIPLVCSLGLSRAQRLKTDTFKRILLIQISAIGDVILLTPALRAIRKRFPHARLTMVTSPINQQLLKNCPYIDEILIFRMNECAKSPRRSVTFVRSLRERRFDLAIDFEHWPRLTALLAYLSGAPRRIGFQTAVQYRHYVFTDTVEHVRGKHELLSFLDIAKLLVCSTAIYRRTELEVWPCVEDFNWVEQFLKGHGVKEDVPLIGIHPDAGRTEPRRRWTKEGYQQVADALAKKYGAQIILTGAPSEVQLSEQIASMTRAKAIIAAGKTDINQLAALFSRCQFVLCGNCGPMHLAAAVKTPVVALHGPTNPAQWGPWGDEHTIICSDMPCSPCLNLGFEYGCKALPDGTSRCMRTIPVETVLSACEFQLTLKS
ncbi:TPA: glycosyltransferase family 9 protein [Candidatus Poribacteria bacterium]|nr:glycosyltransferase family 9 protein [Candidatus Poribacteria bacterium]